MGIDGRSSRSIRMFLAQLANSSLLNVFWKKEEEENGRGNRRRWELVSGLGDVYSLVLKQVVENRQGSLFGRGRVESFCMRNKRKQKPKRNHKYEERVREVREKRE